MKGASMTKMIPIVLILAIASLGGLGIAGYSIKKSATLSATTQKEEPSETPSPEKEQESEDTIMLTISSPVNGTQVSTANIMVKGQTVSNAEIFVNDITGKADANGFFAIGITLDEGENEIDITVNDVNGNSAEKEITVSYSPGT